MGDGAELLCYHGSPRSSQDFLLATTPEPEVIAMLGNHRATVMVGGHVHHPLLRQFGSTLLVNAGSVGQACEWGHASGRPRHPWAEYAVVSAEDGTIGVELGRVRLDPAELAESARERRMPHADWWAGLWDRPASG